MRWLMQSQLQQKLASDEISDCKFNRTMLQPSPLPKNR